MQDKTANHWPRFVRTPEAARLLDLSPRTLEKHRCDGTGPVYHKLGGRVVYDVAELYAWVEASTRRSTSDVTEPPYTPRQPIPPESVDPNGEDA